MQFAFPADSARNLCLCLSLLAWSCGEAEPHSSQPAYWEPIEDFFSGEVGWEVTRENPDRAVEMRAISPFPFLEEGGYDLPFLVMAPPSEVRLRIPVDRGLLRFESFSGAEGTVGAQLPREVRFEVLVDDHAVISVTRRWWPEMTSAERQWQPLPTIEVPPGSELVLRTVLLSALETEPAPELASVGFGRPRLLRRVPRPEAPEGAPNVVFLLMDTLRTDTLTPYGNQRNLTPHLARLAARGTLFENAYSTASWTWPSTASILTGLLPEEHGVLSHLASYLHARARTLPEVLREAGYTTGGFATNPLIDICHNYDQGFDSFKDPRPGFDPTQVVEGDVRRWLRENAERPFFLYLHLVDPHMPYDPLPKFAGKGPRPAIFDRPFLGMAMRDRLIIAMERADRQGRAFDPLDHVDKGTVRALERDYWRCVKSADHWVGEFLAELDALGLTENTIFVFTSDHGEEFLEHDLLAHANSVHRELVQVPLIVAGPGWEPGARVTTPVSNRHLAPTLTRMTGAAPDVLGDGDPLDLAALAGIPERPVYFSTRTSVWRGRRATPVFGMLADNLLVHVFEIPEQDRERDDGALESIWDTRVYDLEQDPGAHVDVSGEDLERTAALRAMVLSRLEQSREYRGAAGPVTSVGAGEAGLQLLRQIGYIGDDE